MKNDQVVALATELFKIRIGSSNEGRAEDDGVHKMEIRGISSYNPIVIEKWYMESIKTAEIIISIGEKYLSGSV